MHWCLQETQVMEEIFAENQLKQLIDWHVNYLGLFYAYIFLCSF